MATGFTALTNSFGGTKSSGGANRHQRRQDRGTILTATSIAHWQDPLGADDWDRLVLGESFMPGVWRIRGSVTRRVDVKDPKGSDGGRLKDEGYQPARLQLEGRMTSEEAWALLQQRMPDLHPKRRGAAREPLFIKHPVAQFLRVQHVYIESIEGPVLDDRGVMSVTIGAIEWNKKPKKKKRNRDKPKEPGGATEILQPPDSSDKITNVPPPV